MKYRVLSDMDDNYKVVVLSDPMDDYYCMSEREQIDSERFVGSPADCEAFIRLTEGGYL